MENVTQELKERIPGLEMTGEEFLRAYHAAPPEARREVRRLIAEDLRRKGDFERSTRILNMKD